MDAQQQDRLFASLVAISDQLATGLDLSELFGELMGTCTGLLRVAAAGILVDDEQGSLRLLASSSDEGRMLEMLELLNDEGPCVEAFRTGEEVLVPRLTDAATKWPTFVPGALGQGIFSACALPLTLRGRLFGALNLFLDTEGGLGRSEMQIARVLARLAAVGILNNAVSKEQDLLAEQLRTALHSRVIIEQAKGVISERAGVRVGAAFDLLRTAARVSQRPLVDVASDVVEGRLSPATVIDG